YLCMNFFITPPILNTIGHISWQLCHGAPPFIYLLLNRTVKKHIKRSLEGSMKRIMRKLYMYVFN
ncbi:hypothetical protein PMAYCL1PPCAC_03897, partial [Pristionchus mayeri]